jgi:hypothetical protein
MVGGALSYGIDRAFSAEDSKNLYPGSGNSDLVFERRFRAFAD